MATLDHEHYLKALDFATKKHSGQKRIGGSDYITHPIAVAELLQKQGYGYDYMIAGLFHDLLEDTSATKEEILSLSNPDVLQAVLLLTKTKGYVMADYVAGIKNNEMAFAVKKADRLHNLSSAFVASEEFRRKYILETIDWYWDFSQEIRDITKKLAQSLSEPIKDFPMLYEDSLTFKI